MSEQPRSNFSDELSLLKMDFLTFVGKRILPSGFWGDSPVAKKNDSESAEDEPRTLYLTFDDGPSPHTTPYLLEILEKENISATFFMIGSHVAKHPELVEQLSKSGHTIGNHSYNHLFMPLLPIRVLEEEIEEANKRIEEIVNFRPDFFRPPFGVADQRIADALKERGMTTVYWGAVSNDWRPIGAERVIARTSRRMSHGTLIVLHEGGWISKQCIKATERIIQIGKQQGFQFQPLQSATEI